MRFEMSVRELRVIDLMWRASAEIAEVAARPQGAPNDRIRSGGARTPASVARPA